MKTAIRIELIRLEMPANTLNRLMEPSKTMSLIKVKSAKQTLLLEFIANYCPATKKKKTSNRNIDTK